MKNKVAFISGGLGDIGRAIAVAFGRQGMRVAMCDEMDETLAQPRLDELKLQGCANLFYKKASVTSAEDIEKVFSEIEEHWDIPQVVVANAGIVVVGSLTHDLAKENVQKQMDVNFWGSYHVAIQSAKNLKAKALPGRIVFIGSWAAERPNARISAYCISKAATRMLCKTMALELAADNILVNEVAPCIVDGGLSKQNQQKDPALLKTHLNAIPAHQLVSVQEVADTVVMLAGFTNMNITGTTILVDGGISLTSKMTP
jgi:glucose 1-dehydrogenase